MTMIFMKAIRPTSSSIALSVRKSNMYQIYEDSTALSTILLLVVLTILAITALSFSMNARPLIVSRLIGISLNLHGCFFL